MSLENEVKISNPKKIETRDYLPFGVNFLETPRPIGYTERDMLNYTSVTFCTFKCIPLIDDGD